MRRGFEDRKLHHDAIEEEKQNAWMCASFLNYCKNGLETERRKEIRVLEESLDATELQFKFPIDRKLKTFTFVVRTLRVQHSPENKRFFLFHRHHHHHRECWILSQSDVPVCECKGKKMERVSWYSIKITMNSWEYIHVLSMRLSKNFFFIKLT